VPLVVLVCLERVIHMFPFHLPSYQHMDNSFSTTIIIIFIILFYPTNLREQVEAFRSKKAAEAKKKLEALNK
jgi:hypothetical protein